MKRGYRPDLFRPSSYRLPTVAEYRPHPTVLGWKSVGNGRSAVGVRREPPSARVFRPPSSDRHRTRSDVAGRRDEISPRRSSDRHPTGPEHTPKHPRRSIGPRSSFLLPPTVIRPFTTVFTSSSDRHPTGIRTRSDDVENARPAVSSVHLPPIFRPSSIRGRSDEVGTRDRSEDGRKRSG